MNPDEINSLIDQIQQSYTLAQAVIKDAQQAAQIATDAYSAFFNAYQGLEKTSQWDRILEMGEAILAQEPEDPEKDAVLNIALSSCYLYKGKYSQGLTCAVNALSRAGQLLDVNLQGHSLSLIASLFRAMVQDPAHSTAQAPALQSLTQQAQAAIDQGLKLVEDPNLMPEVAAKICTDAAAVAQELKGDFDRANQLYHQAKSFVQPGSQSHTLAAIGHLSSLVAQGALDMAKAQAKEITIDDAARAGVQFFKVMADLSHKEGKPEEALKHAQKALEKAAQHGLKQEKKQLKAKLKTLSPSSQYLINGLLSAGEKLQKDRSPSRKDPSPIRGDASPRKSPAPSPRKTTEAADSAKPAPSPRK